MEKSVLKSWYLIWIPCIKGLMGKFVTLYDVRVVDGFLLRLDVIKYLNCEMNFLCRLRELILDYGDFLGTEFVNSLRRMYFKRRMDLSVNLYMLREINVLSGKNYFKLCNDLEFMEKEI